MGFQLKCIFQSNFTFMIKIVSFQTNSINSFDAICISRDIKMMQPYKDNTVL